MDVPKDIQAMVLNGLQRMNEHPDHHYDWRNRRDMYQLMQDKYGQEGRDAGRWLALITAKKVLPIFTSTIPDDPLPQNLVYAAHQIMTQVISSESESISGLLDDGYHGTGIDCVLWRSVTAYNAEYAGHAAYCSLGEAMGYPSLLQKTEEYARVDAEITRTTPEKITDLDIAHIDAYGDTAGAAAIAASSQKKHLRLNRKKLRAFWKWWAEIAIPEAWAKV